MKWIKRARAARVSASGPSMSITRFSLTQLLRRQLKRLAGRHCQENAKLLLFQRSDQGSIVIADGQGSDQGFEVRSVEGRNQICGPPFQGHATGAWRHRRNDFTPAAAAGAPRCGALQLTTGEEEERTTGDNSPGLPLKICGQLVIAPGQSHNIRKRRGPAKFSPPAPGHPGPRPPTLPIRVRRSAARCESGGHY